MNQFFIGAGNTVVYFTAEIVIFERNDTFLLPIILQDNHAFVVIPTSSKQAHLYVNLYNGGNTARAYPMYVGERNVCGGDKTPEECGTLDMWELPPCQQYTVPGFCNHTQTVNQRFSANVTEAGVTINGHLPPTMQVYQRDATNWRHTPMNGRDIPATTYGQTAILIADVTFISAGQALQRGMKFTPYSTREKGWWLNISRPRVRYSSASAHY